MTEESSELGGILNAVRETARDLHGAGLIDKRRMAEYDALCLQPVSEYDGNRIRVLQDSYHLSQAILASIRNTK
ncbi:MAG: hypothetical protein H7829_07380 [Magnetococcus sp. THC-1_WYH]